MAVEPTIDQVHRLSVEEYRAMVAAGHFGEGARVEFIDGLILDMSPKSREHEKVIAWLARRFVAGTDGAEHEVRIASPLSIDDSEPEPDVAVVAVGTPEPNHPASAELVVEVTVSSQRRDRLEKPRLYARAGVPVYWVVDLDAGEAVVHTGPRGDGYAAVRVVGEGGVLEAAHVGLAPIAVADALAAARRR